MASSPSGTSAQPPPSRRQSTACIDRTAYPSEAPSGRAFRHLVQDISRGRAIGAHGSSPAQAFPGWTRRRGSRFALGCVHDGTTIAVRELDTFALDRHPDERGLEELVELLRDLRSFVVVARDDHEVHELAVVHDFALRFAVLIFAALDNLVRSRPGRQHS